MLEITMLPTEQIRDWHDTEEERVFALYQSMVTDGFLREHPLLVNEREDGGYRLIDGHHRRASALRAGIPEVPALVVPRDFQLSEEKLEQLRSSVSQWLTENPISLLCLLYTSPSPRD